MKKLLFAITDYEYLAEKVLALGHCERGEIEVSHFTDGERYQRILSNVEGRDVLLIGGTVNDSATLELYDLASSLVSYGADSLTLVIPYFGYSTMERAVKAGEIVTAKTRARLLSAIPKSNRGNKVMLFDLHSEGIQYYFEQDLYPVHVYCKDIVIEAATRYGGDNFVMASTDAGRAKWVESLANDMGVNAAFILKRRLKGDHTEVSAINADVAGKTVIIYDDMIRSGGSIVNAAMTYKNAGAGDIYVITTHGLFVNDGIGKLKACGAIKKLICTDTHVNCKDLEGDDFVEVRTVAGLICG
ncbi:ribose-phosphate pyrophosphokinase [Mucilaginibacter rubeus]|uniref:ribose-phosphate diphosphokinase n=1 Tax=Mucilaginibacter rubeus TaxID=2027860 RepID=A0AAE6JBT1_9SPHI|nr:MULTISPECIES: ribose-phosphate diphosphokinase [Mucilaginibacter]QEM02789.1 ribose-phosphate pyrophosphokinase [Mucilaginibacter rubeus]QEM15407.1 ribose-phosphate pyrophosphokinase [Mucilaginibacter gossypii]QTE41864.1 ribose-phosphate pyrophosphokinase [Mucilaginibacter rubeus]QTE48467.1 ribose-phosphate pyrophosphokinase [Mucilaginibacter rubeus]QTE59853.1 ribose-phosphate pyrophosphokinase [Mucilaginibacter rubeus]